MSYRLAGYVSLRWVITITLTFLLVSSSYAQTFRGGISGTVTDQSGAVVPNAVIKATNSGTGVTTTKSSSSAGDYIFQDLPLGSYTVSVSAPGFQVIKISKVPVSAGAIYTLPLKLNVATSSTTVEVAAASLTLDTTTAAQSAVIPSRSVQDVPMNGRDFTQFLALTPGFSGYSGSGFGSVNGTRPNQVNWQIEGADNNDLWWNIPAVNQGGVSGIAGITLPLDAIDQFSMVTQANPETGRNPGGTVNLVIKSGTNALHGSAYYFNRNEALGAKPVFSVKNKLRNQQYGFSLGGPIIKDRTFYFVTYEHQNFIIGVGNQATEPTQAYQALAKQELANYGISVNPVAQNLLNTLWPQDALNGPASSPNYANPGTEHGYSYNGLVKLDHAFNDKNRFSFKWYVGQGNQIAPTSSTLTPYFEVAPIHVQNYSLTYNEVITPKLTNQVFIGVNYFNQVFSDLNHSYDPGALGLNTGVSDPALSGAPRINISPALASLGLGSGGSGFDPVGITVNSGRNDITGHLDDAVSYTLGKHELRFGGEFRQAQIDDFYQSGQRGTFNFSGAQGPWASAPASGQNPTACQQLATKNLGMLDTVTQDQNIFSLADFMAGCVTNANIVQGNPKRQIFVNTFDLFAQDAWQVSSKLNLNYGLRYDYVGPFHSQYQNLSVFRPGVTPTGLAVAGKDISSLYPQFWKAISPRVGFAYQPKSNGDLVIRGGAGIFFDQPNLVGFLNERATSNGGPFGVQDNPAGTDQVAQSAVGAFVIQQNAQIFPQGVTTPSASNIVNLFSVSPTFQPSYNINFNINIQKSLGKSAVAQIGYVGTEARHLLTVIDINQAALGSSQVNTTNGQGYTFQQTTRPYFNQFPDYGVINQITSNANSNYSSLQATLRTSNWHGFTSQFNYTWSHNLDEMSQIIPFLPENSLNLKGDYGNSDYDVRNTYTAFFSYDVPGFVHGPKWFMQGWQLNSLMNFHGGQPFTVYCGCDQSGTAEYSDRADQIGNPYAGVSHKIVDGAVQWINPAAFASSPTVGTYGTTRRNQYYGPGFGDVDLSVFKNTHVTEKISTQFRIEMFNLFNRVNLAPPSNYLGGGFGQSTTTIGVYNGAPGIGAGEPFNTQLALKILF